MFSLKMVLVFFVEFISFALFSIFCVAFFFACNVGTSVKAMNALLADRHSSNKDTQSNAFR